MKYSVQDTVTIRRELCLSRVGIYLQINQTYRVLISSNYSAVTFWPFLLVTVFCVGWNLLFLIVLLFCSNHSAIMFGLFYHMYFAEISFLCIFPIPPSVYQSLHFIIYSAKTASFYGHFAILFSPSSMLME